MPQISVITAASRVASAIMVWLSVYMTEACTQWNFFSGYRCEDRSDPLQNISSLLWEECTLLCTQRADCVQVNYNHVGKNCLLFSSFCALAEPDEEFVMLRFADDVVARDECARWSPFTGVFPTGGIIINAPVGYSEHLLVRGTLNSDIIPGKIYTKNWHFYSAHDGQSKRITTNIEYLDIHPSCFGVWVPYTSGLGKGLPEGAVQGGLLTSGTPLYVARTSNGISPGTSMGYYDPNMDAGVIIDAGVITRTQMDILVLIWLTR